MSSSATDHPPPPLAGGQKRFLKSDLNAKNTFGFRNPHAKTHHIYGKMIYVVSPHVAEQTVLLALQLIWLGKHFHPNPVVTDRCFGIEVLFWARINHQKRQTENHRTKCIARHKPTAQTPQTLFYSNESFECHLPTSWQHWYGRWLRSQYKCIYRPPISRPFI